MFIFIAFTKARDERELVRWRTDLHNYQEQKSTFKSSPQGFIKKKKERNEERNSRTVKYVYKKQTSGLHFFVVFIVPLQSSDDVIFQANARLVPLWQLQF